MRILSDLPRFFALSRDASRLELCDLLLSPTLNILPSTLSSPSSAIHSSSSSAPSFPLRLSLRTSWPTAVIPLNATPTHVCISSGSTYVHPHVLSARQKALLSKKGLGAVYTHHFPDKSDVLPKIYAPSPQRRYSVIPFASLINRYNTSLSSPWGDQGRGGGSGASSGEGIGGQACGDSPPPPPPFLRGRLIAVAVWHEGEEAPMVEECLTERNALQLEQLELEGKRRTTKLSATSSPTGQGNDPLLQGGEGARGGGGRQRDREQWRREQGSSAGYCPESLSCRMHKQTSGSSS